MMKLTPGILALSLIAQCVYANVDETNFIAKMAHTIDYVEKNQDAVWPGFHLNATPIVIDFWDFDTSSEHIYALNFTPVNLPWQKLDVDNHTVYYMDQNLIDPFLNWSDGTIREVDTQPSYIDAEITQFIAPQENFYNKLTISRADLYLRTESKLDFANFAGITKPYDGFYNTTNMKLMYLEHAALSASLQNKGRAAESELQDAAAIQQYRRSLLDKDAAAYEYAAEIYRGIPALISWNSMNLNEKDYIFKTHLTACRPLSLLIGVDGLISCAISGNPHFTSTTFGRALETKLSSANWKKAVEAEFKSPGKLVQEYYQMSDAQAEVLAKNAMTNAKYNYARISGVVDQMILPYVKKMHEEIQNFHDEPGVEFYAPWVWNYIAILIQTMFGMGGDMYLINTNSLFQKDFAENEFYTDDNRLDVSFDNVKFGFANMVLTNDGMIDGANSWSVFKVDHDTQITIDGEQYTADEYIQSRQQRSFNNLKVKDSHMKVELNGLPGVLDGSSGSLKLTVTENAFKTPDRNDVYTLLSAMSDHEAWKKDYYKNFINKFFHYNWKKK